MDNKWENRFDDKFYLESSGFDAPLLGENIEQTTTTHDTLEPIKAFIRTLLASQKAELAEKVRGIKSEYTKFHQGYVVQPPWTQRDIKVRNAALDAVLKKLDL